MNKEELKADLEDRIYTQKKSSNVPITVASVVVLAVFGAFGLKHYKEQQAKQELIERIAEEQAFQERLKNLPKPNEQPSSRLKITEPSTPPARQTVFNDDNYKPRQPVNTIPAPTVKNRTQERINKGVLIERKVGIWNWTSRGAGGEKHSSGKFTYVVKNGVIDTSSICANEKYGSLRYRDCRKGAKIYFKKRCSNHNPEACTAINMMP